MQQQNQIKRTLGQPESMDIVRSHLASNNYKNRTSLPKALCLHFNFSDARKGLQIGRCNKALRELERAGHFILPVSGMPKSIKTPRRLGVAWPTQSMYPRLSALCKGSHW